ncbi:flagellar basal body-associated protein FliL [Priestia endophytica]|jgi:flagellar protein FliL|uniref:Flagellar protein FliL n=2 Tax=Priestia endophytica TaxID=135735 RepID=A0AAX1QD89_9BACI|nr:flagellar basal body-associated protein FliL [Priestia endophytica]KAB2494690.1 flagellar basal body-associated protein FliL [Priestia endophytica]KYG35758.1 flagellar basal body-associated protein FliL [Priestia endophytica]RAS76753.1 flagellar basal body-associated protein FliL [Priestia endophytica]RAS79511.1 flagellar basal body-associated protein FliL [Priestia endophytica]RAS84185.1 flagellar basal body-associated protein FliL [Priestia endophytica]
MGKKVKIITIIIFLLLLAGGSTWFFLFKKEGKAEEVKEPSIDEVVESSVNMDDVTTNLSSENYIKMSFTLQTNSKEAKEELTKREFQVRDLMIKQLSNMKVEQFRGKEGISSLEQMLKEEINSLMQEGKVVKIYTTSKIIQ